jgi:hypothetical protein
MLFTFDAKHVIEVLWFSVYFMDSHYVFCVLDHDVDFWTVISLKFLLCWNVMSGEGKLAGSWS